MVDKDILKPLYYSTNCKAFMEDILGLKVKWFHEEWINNFENFKKFLLLAPRGHGKCFRKGSKMNMANGAIKNIEDVKVGDIVIGKDDHEQLVPLKVNGFVDNGIKDIFRIKLSNGRELEVTNNHPFYTGHWTSIKDGLSVGNKVAIPRAMPRFNTIKYYTDEELTILAYLIAEGTITDKCAFQFSNTNDNIVSVMKNALKSINCELKDVGNNKDYRVNNKKPLRDLLIKSDLLGTYSYNKFIPKEIFSSPKYQIKLFLKRLWQCDGSINENYRNCVDVSYSTSSKQLALDVQTLLMYVGIQSDIHEHKTPCLLNYQVIVLSPNTNKIKFINEILDMKNYPVIDTLKLTNTHSNVDTVPRALIQEKQQISNWKYRKLHNLRIDNNYDMLFDKLGKMMKIEYNNEDLQDLYHANIRWVEIKSIEYIGKDQTYGIEVDKYHNHVSNGIITHNTILVSAYIIWRIVQNPEIRILLVSVKHDLAKDILGIVMDTFERNEKLKNIFGDFVGKTWTTSCIKVKKRNSTGISQREKTVMTIGVTGSLVGPHFDLIIMDDIMDETNSSTEGQREGVRQWYKKTLRPTLMRNGQMICVGCVTGDTKVLMSDGTWKDIKDISVGEQVKSHYNGKIVNKPVRWSGCTGVDTVYEVKTDSTKLKANEKHPFLTIAPTSKSGKYIKDYELHWKRTIDLQRGDMILSTHTLDNKCFPYLSKNIKVNKDFMWLYGYLMGDGWVTHRKKTNGRTNKLYDRYIINVSYTNKIEELNKVKKLFKKVFNIKLKERNNKNLYSCNKNIGQILYRMNLGMGAKNKEIPNWIFNLPLELRQSFIKGLLKADGWKCSHGKSSYGIELVNEKLIKQLQLLSKISGLRTSNITHRVRIIKAPNSKEKSRHDFYHVRVNWNKHFGSKSFIYNAKDKFPYNFYGIDRVKEVIKLNKEKIYDITVDDTHNFIAEGLITHNTRWHSDDIYGHFIKKGWKHKRYQAIMNPKEVRDGKPADMLWKPEDINGISLGFSYDDALEYIHENGRLAFEMQYQNQIIQTADSPIREKWVTEAIEKFEELKQIPRNEVYIGVDIASQGGKDYFALTVISVDKDKNIYVLDNIRDHLSMGEQLRQIKLACKWGAATVAIESNAAQKIITDEWKNKIPARVLQVSSSTGKGKVYRAQKISVYFETGRIFMNPQFKHLKNELIEFPKSEHDDCLDSLGFAIQAFEDNDAVDWNYVRKVVRGKRVGNFKPHKI